MRVPRENFDYCDPWIARGVWLINFPLKREPPKAWFPYNRRDRTKQCTGDPGDFMETAEENLGTIEMIAAIMIAW